MTARTGVTPVAEITPTRLPGIKAGPDVRVLTSERMQLVHAIVPAGTVLPEHRHEAEQITFIMRGKISATIGNEEFVAGAGDFVFVPSNIPHQFCVLEELHAVEAFSSVRPELVADRGCVGG